MTTDDRYDVSGLPEAQFEPASNGLVLKTRKWCQEQFFLSLVAVFWGRDVKKLPGSFSWNYAS